jgi:hypothetical protein
MLGEQHTPCTPTEDTGTLKAGKPIQVQRDGHTREMHVTKRK